MRQQRGIQSCFAIMTFLSSIAMLVVLQSLRRNGYSHEILRYVHLLSQFRGPPSAVDYQNSTAPSPHSKKISGSAKVDSFSLEYKVGTTVKMQSKLDVSANPHLKVSTQLSRPVNITSLTAGDKLWGCYHYYGNTLGASRNPAGLDVLSELNCSRKVPSVILLGVKKCGSQTLTGFLDLHPDIVSRVFPFSEKTTSSLKENNDAFLKAMPLSTPNEQTFIDMIEIQNDPQFLAHLTTNLNSDTTKYLLILVNPVARAQSDYVHVNVKMKLPQNSKLVKCEKLSVWDKKLLHRKEKNVLFKGYRIAGTFERSVLNASGSIDKGNNLIKKGIYYDYVKEILKYVSRDRLLVVDGEQFIREPWLVLKQVEKFLGINSYFKKSFFAKIGKFYCPVFIERPDAGCLKGKGRKKKKIDQKTNKRLQRFFEPYNQKLENLLGEKLSWM